MLAYANFPKIWLWASGYLVVCAQSYGRGKFSVRVSPVSARVKGYRSGSGISWPGRALFHPSRLLLHRVKYSVIRGFNIPPGQFISLPVRQGTCSVQFVFGFYSLFPKHWVRKDNCPWCLSTRRPCFALRELKIARWQLSTQCSYFFKCFLHSVCM